MSNVFRTAFELPKLPPRIIWGIVLSADMNELALLCIALIVRSAGYDGSPSCVVTISPLFSFACLYEVVCMFACMCVWVMQAGVGV